jgi:2-polyprenyl-6-hydroxyphenyl methylase/3-demethylubiquinone-9 3-methyltransferase
MITRATSGFSPTIVRRFIDWNQRVSGQQRAVLGRFVPGTSRDGPTDFRDRVLPSLLRPGLCVLDVGGGKFPAISLETKGQLGLKIVGLDISEKELCHAPDHVYDMIVVGDVATVEIPLEYDLVFSRTLLEHVKDPAAAIGNLARSLAPGGTMAHVVPCGNALFAILNRLLGNRVARRLLFAIYPHKAKNSGFPAYYRHCTPGAMSRLCQANGLTVVAVIPYYRSDYGAFFVPFNTIELLRQALMCGLGFEDFAEGFTIVARR